MKLNTTSRWALCLSLLTVCLALPTSVHAELMLPNLFTDHMVLQRNQENPVWGWDEPGTKVTVTIADQTHSATADDQGRWQVKLTPLKAGGPFELSIKTDGESSPAKTISDVLVGEVWVCSGQSNMAWTVANSDDPDLEILTANYPQIRLISVPNRASQDAEKNFAGKWDVCTPETVREFSAVGYFFGRQLHQTLDVPIGLIDNAWGGSAAEAWVNRDLLESTESMSPLAERWKSLEKTYDFEKIKAATLEKWEQQKAAAAAAGKPAPRKPRMRNLMTGNNRPGNLYGGCLHPIIGYGIRGAIWYQGESNASRAYQYRQLFPLMISNWREEWGQGDFPFYWVSLADFRREAEQPRESDWAELREAQTMTLALPNTGEAIITDLGEADDIHPRNKQGVAKRLARLALANDYGYELVANSPRYTSHEVVGDKIVITVDTFGSKLDTFDVREPIGFTISGEDRVFLPATAKIVAGDKIEVMNPAVKNPVAVRYAWADNPVCNVQNVLGLPLTPFRTDDWDGVTINNQ